MMHSELPVPDHLDPDKVAKVCMVPFQRRAKEAEEWASKHSIKPSASEDYKISLIVVDVQNTFAFQILSFSLPVLLEVGG